MSSGDSSVFQTRANMDVGQTFGDGSINLMRNPFLFFSFQRLKKRFDVKNEKISL